MLKKSLILLAVSFFATTGISFADTTIPQIQSPIYTDNLGRSHFLGKGGYSGVRSLDMGGAYASAVNEVANEIKSTEKEVRDNLDKQQTNITNVIKEINWSTNSK